MVGARGSRKTHLRAKKPLHFISASDKTWHTQIEIIIHNRIYHHEAFQLFLPLPLQIDTLFDLCIEFDVIAVTANWLEKHELNCVDIKGYQVTHVVRELKRWWLLNIC